MSKTLYLIRGLPGTGKSTIGLKLADSYVSYHPTMGGPRHHSYAADDWFYNDKGEYNFNPDELANAHEECFSRVLGAMMSNVENICVCNTFSQSWEAEPYFKTAKRNDYTVVVIECQTEFGNIHDCPQDKIDLMAKRWDRSIDPTSSKRWERAEFEKQHD